MAERMSKGGGSWFLAERMTKEGGSWLMAERMSKGGDDVMYKLRDAGMTKREVGV